VLSCRPGFERLGNDGLASARFNAVVPEQAFVYVCSIAHARRHLGWLVIILCHMIYRQRLARGDVTKKLVPVAGSRPRCRCWSSRSWRS